MAKSDTGSAWFHPPALLLQQGKTPWHDRQKPGDGRYDDKTKQTVLDRIYAVLLGRTWFVLDRGICAPTELNWMTRTALGFSPGLVELGHSLGAARIKELCSNYAAKHPGFEVPASIREQRLVEFDRTLTVSRQGEVAILSVFRPEVKNALNDRVIFEIDRAVAALEADATVKGIIFTSFDGALAGADISELAALPTPAACRDVCLRAHQVLARIASASKPIIAAVDGPVLGGGAEFSMACHARVVGNDLVLGQPEVNLGILPGYGGTQRLPRLIGWQRAQLLIRTARTANASEACEWGWATGQPESSPLEAAKRLIADHVAGRIRLAPVSSAPIDVPAAWPAVELGHRSKRIDEIVCDVMSRGLKLPLEQGVAIEAEGFARCKATVDMDIGMKNFMQNGPRVPAVFLHE